MIDTYGSNEATVRLVVDGVSMMEAIAEGREADHNDQGCNTVNIRLRKSQNVWLDHNGIGGK